MDEVNPELFDEAVKACEKWCKANNVIFDQPNARLSNMGRKYVYLVNANGLLAKYDYKAKKIIAP